MNEVYDRLKQGKYQTGVRGGIKVHVIYHICPKPAGVLPNEAISAVDKLEPLLPNAVQQIPPSRISLKTWFYNLSDSLLMCQGFNGAYGVPTMG